ncbi:NAD-dependent epimerase/dehydratase family protein [Spirosoma sp. HMF4905]|uniref:NAD-dependent epimerase/dehydratase family protein n=1 Tax=Spirosoma arboris TaxID=2682092 RepID=A0A7K1SC68_9BACT|nr:aldehyde reductase [Spirosoma arboris]MVM31365.1 NAD-dependent epimerase/dehydratase family protein [Spirosoma arboris]
MKKSTVDKTVLVTGGSGFIAVHCMIQLLNAGYRIRATLRSLKREDEVRAMLKEGGVDAGQNLSFVTADLGADAGWAEAVAGCEYVLHIASPTPLNDYKHEDELIIPAREGVLRVLRAARDANVKRVVLTSAFGAIGIGHKHRTTPFTETDWSILDDSTPAYQKSKTLAERAAWDFIAKEGNGLELAAVNPVGVLGPVLGPDFSHSIQLTKRMLNGEIAACPKISSCYIDVRDVASLHLLAMTHPAANGERFLAVSGASLTLLDIANVLRRRLGAWAQRVPAREIPNWLLRIVALRNPTLKMLIPMLGQYMDASGEKAKRLLGWSPRSNEEAIVDTAESLLRFGLVKTHANGN